MGKSKKTEKTQQNQQFSNVYDYVDKPESQDVQAVRDWKPTVDPGIGYTYARARQGIRNSFNNPLGADTPAAVKDAILQESEESLAQQEAQDLRLSENDANQQELQKRIAVAGFTDPQLVQTSGTSSGSGTTTQQMNSGIGSIISTAASVGLGLA